jgi:hypothetical protein
MAWAWLRSAQNPHISIRTGLFIFLPMDLYCGFVNTDHPFVLYIFEKEIVDGLYELTHSQHTFCKSATIEIYAQSLPDVFLTVYRGVITVLCNSSVSKRRCRYHRFGNWLRVHGWDFGDSLARPASILHPLIAQNIDFGGIILSCSLASTAI